MYIESIGNPKLDILDVESISKIAKKAKLPLVVDNTVATHVIKPIDYGADIVIVLLQIHNGKWNFNRRYYN